jgi:hypothetical protein
MFLFFLSPPLPCLYWNKSLLKLPPCETLVVRHLEMLFMFVDLKDLRLFVETGKLWEPLSHPLVTIWLYINCISIMSKTFLTWHEKETLSTQQLGCFYEGVRPWQRFKNFLFLFGVWTQGLMLARQALYHLIYSTSPFLVGYFLR